MNVMTRKFLPGDQDKLKGMILELYREDPGGEAMDLQKITATIHYLQQNPKHGNIVILENDNPGYRVCYINQFLKQ